MKNGNTPASPLTGDAYTNFSHLDETGNTSYDPECQGLTKREHFAGLAMQGLLHVTFATSLYGTDVCEYELCANAAVKQADALLKELDK